MLVDAIQKNAMAGLIGRLRVAWQYGFRTPQQGQFDCGPHPTGRSHEARRPRHAAGRGDVAWQPVQAKNSLAVAKHAPVSSEALNEPRERAMALPPTRFAHC
jgi:hypothetical protein